MVYDLGRRVAPYRHVVEREGRAEPRSELNRRLRSVIEREDIYYWLEKQLDTVFSLRK